MAMERRYCRDCGSHCLHNPIPAKKAEAGAWRCTYCGSPLGTGPKADRMRDLNKRQINKRLAGLS